jgi:hypothetical protein
MPSRTSAVRFSPCPSFSSTSTTRSDWCTWWKPPGTTSFSTRSPACPKGVCPRSWPITMASTSMSLRRRALAMERATWATSSVWVRRLR